MELPENLQGICRKIWKLVGGNHTQTHYGTTMITMFGYRLYIVNKNIKPYVEIKNVPYGVHSIYHMFLKESPPGKLIDLNPKTFESFCEQYNYPIPILLQYKLISLI